MTATLSGNPLKSSQSGQSLQSPFNLRDIKSPLSAALNSRSTHYTDKRDEAEQLGSNKFRVDVLQANGVLIAETELNAEMWSNTSSAMGIPTNAEPLVTSELARLAYRMRKKKLSDPQMVEKIAALMESLTLPLGLSQQGESEFFPDAVPTLEELKNSTRRLPTPAPSISVGYRQSAFSQFDEELQKGIICDENGFPVDLYHISQPAYEHYWPFLVIEVSEHSMTAAKNACAVTASTCNNALSYLCRAAADQQSDSGLNKRYHSFENTTQCFSVAISGSTACLNLHSPAGRFKHVTSTIQTYELTNDNDLGLLVCRLHSILAWGRFTRLPEIIDQLDALDRKVHGRTRPMFERHHSNDFDPAIFRTLDLRVSNRKKRGAIMAATGVPFWPKENGPLTT